MMKLRYAGAILLGLALVLDGPRAQAVEIEDCDSTEDLADLEGSVTYASSSDTKATLTVTLENTSTTSDSLYITAFAIGDPTGADVTNAWLTSTPLGWSPFLDVSTSPYEIGSGPGDDNFGAGIGGVGGEWLGGGNPIIGIPIGGSGTFVIVLTGSGLSSLTADDFLTEGNVLVRFRGDAGSDKVVVCPDDGQEEPPGEPIPEPSTVTLAVLGVAGLVRKLRRKTA